jgi:hypothetical protein
MHGLGLEDGVGYSLLMCEGGRPLVGSPRLGDGSQYSLLILNGGLPRVGIPPACGGRGARGDTDLRPP